MVVGECVAVGAVVGCIVGAFVDVGACVAVGAWLALGTGVTVGALVAVGAGVANRQLVLKTYVLFGGNTGFSESGGGTMVTFSQPVAFPETLNSAAQYSRRSTNLPLAIAFSIDAASDLCGNQSVPRHRADVASMAWRFVHSQRRRRVVRQVDAVVAVLRVAEADLAAGSPGVAHPDG